MSAAADGAADAASSSTVPDTFEAAIAADLGETEAQQDESDDTDAEDVEDVDAEDSGFDEDEGFDDDESADNDADADAEDDDEDSAQEDDAEDDDEDSADDNPKAWDKLPKWTRDRLSKQSAQIRDLKAQAAKLATIAPTPLAPLADVETAAELDQRLKVARSVRDWVKANHYGGTLYNGSEPIEIDEDTAQRKLAAAEAVIDAAPDLQRRLAVRSETKPWEQAEAICPNLFKAGTEEHAFAAEALKRCPEMKTRLDNWEMFLAAAVRGLTQAAEESRGLAKYVRVPAKKAGATQQESAKVRRNVPPPVLKKSPPQSKSGKKPDIDQLRKRAAESRDPSDFAMLVAAEIAA